MYVLFLLFLLLTPNESSAEVYACHTVDGDTYTESPQRTDCRLLDIQPPALVYERTCTGKGVEARPNGPWPQGSAEAQAEICGLNREWIMLGRKRDANAYDFPPHGLTPLEITRLNNLDVLFSNRGNPNCGKQ